MHFLHSFMYFCIFLCIFCIFLIIFLYIFYIFTYFYFIGPKYWIRLLRKADSRTCESLLWMCLSYPPITGGAMFDRKLAQCGCILVICVTCFEEATYIRVRTIIELEMQFTRSTGSYFEEFCLLVC